MGTSLGAPVRASLGTPLGAPVRTPLGAPVRASLGAPVRTSLGAPLWAFLPSGSEFGGFMIRKALEIVDSIFDDLEVEEERRVNSPYSQHP